MSAKTGFKEEDIKSLLLGTQKKLNPAAAKATAALLDLMVQKKFSSSFVVSIRSITKGCRMSATCDGRSQKRKQRNSGAGTSQACSAQAHGGLFLIFCTFTFLVEQY